MYGIVAHVEVKGPCSEVRAKFSPKTVRVSRSKLRLLGLAAGEFALAVGLSYQSL